MQTTASGENTLRAFLVALAAVVVILGLAARLYNVNWDENTHLHPDERHLSIVANDVSLPSDPIVYFDSDASKLNPYNREGGGSFVYGTLPLFLTKATAAAFDQDNYDDLVLVGRRLSALFDAGTVLLVFLIGRRLYGPLAGLIGSLLYASAPLAIQHAHFFVVDPFLTFFMTAGLYFSVRIAQEGRRGDYALAGLALGLGTACKLTSLALLPVIGVVVLVRLWPALRGLVLRPFDAALDAQAQDERDDDVHGVVRKGLVGLVLLLAVGFLAFRIAQPYAFEAPGLSPLSWVDLDDRFVRDQREQGRLLGGEVGFPPSVQWIDRTSYLYPLQEMVRWGMGPAFGVIGWLAAAYAAYRLLRFHDRRHLLPLLFVLVYFGFMGRQFSLYLRYFLPLYPVLAVLGGFALVDLLRWARERQVRFPSLPAERASQVLVAIGLVLALFFGIAYLSVYSRPVTRVEASRWIYQNLPAGSDIAGEHWDDNVPMRLPGSPDKQFRLTELGLYELDTQDKVEKLIAALDATDYVVLSSNRLLNSIPRNPVNYPVTSRYYELLLEERLGFRLLREFTSYPSFLGIKVPDARSAEAWTSYDHPPVLVFEKGPDYARARLESLLGAGPFATAGLTPQQADRNGLLLSPQDAATQQAGGTWTDVFSDSALVRDYPALLWFAVVQAAALAVTPLTLVLFRRLPDRGYLLAKPLGLLLLAYPVWLLVSLKVIDFDRVSVLAILVALLLSGAAIAWHKRRDVLTFLREHWRLVLFCEVLFAAAFLLFLAFRFENPDLWHPHRGGEKPMDLAYLTALARSTTLPPYDPWFSGGYINYYYLGHFFTATLMKATSIPPEVAFNLAVPAYFALTVATAFSVSFNLASAAKGFVRRRAASPPRWSIYAAGLAGAAFVALLGNLDGVGQLVERLSEVSAWHVDAPVIGAIANSLGGLWQVVFHGAGLGPFDYWRSSRMMPPTISITEFPYFTFLFADLHAHLMAIPFEVLAVGASLSLVLRRRGERDGWQEWGIVALLGLVVGSLRWLNSWDYPPFLLLALAAVAISERRLDGGAVEASKRLGLKALVLVGLSYLLYAPFLATYQAPVSGVQATPETTPVHQYLAHFGVFAFAITVWLAYLAARALKPSPLLPFLMTSQALSERSRTWLVLAGLAGSTVLIAMLVAVADGRPLVAVLLPLLAVVAYLALRELRLRRPDGGLRLFVLSLVGLGLGLSIGVEFVTINGDIQRMNTVFKFYLHIWVVFALVAAYAAWSLVFVYWRPSLRPRPALSLQRLAAAGGGVALAALVLGALLYPAFATSVRLDDRFVDLPATLDGTTYMPQVVYSDPKGPIDLAQDYEGILWLRENVDGTPVIVEGRADLYRWTSRFSIYTGLPTVVGWDWHQRQQRGDLAFMVDQRNRQVDAFYTNPDVAQAQRFLKQYNVRYVILGQTERLYYPSDGLAKFQNGLNGALEPVFQNAGLAIFKVRTDVLANASP